LLEEGDQAMMFALATPAALLATYPRLASLGVCSLLIGVGATVWAGAAGWTARQRQWQWRDAVHTLLCHIDAAIILTDLRGTITAMNDAAESLTGWREAAAIGMPVGAVFQLVDPQTHRRVVNPAVKALYKAVVVGPSPDALLTRDGETRQIRDLASPIRDGHGRVVGCAIVCRDRGEPVIGGRRVEIQEARH
jgi:PAS domain S-box-containing protein